MPLSAPTKFGTVWNASGVNRNTIPVASQIGVTPGLASYTDGFPPLTMTPIASGGVPPFGQDFNGLGYAVTLAIQWLQAGGGYAFDSSFASTVGGYPLGAEVQRSDGLGFWVNTSANNSTGPESATSGTNWIPLPSNTTFSTSMASGSVTLTAIQAANPIIILTGLLTASVNLILPTWAQKWLIVNNCTNSGNNAYGVTVKTPSGSGVVSMPGSSLSIYGDGTNINQVNPNGQNRQHGQCRLALSGGNLVLSPVNGNGIVINMLMQTVPSAGVSLPATGLTASTLYYIYAYMNSGTMTLEASTTAYATDASSGVTIKSGDVTRTLVGMAYPVAGPVFVDSNTQRYVRSWFNDPGISGISYFTASRSTTSNGTYVELNSEIRVNFLTWSGEIVHVSGAGVSTESNALVTNNTAVGFDGTNTELGSYSSGYGPTNNFSVPYTINFKKTGLSEGAHYATLLASVGGSGTATYSGGTPTSSNPAVCTMGIYTKK